MTKEDIKECLVSLSGAMRKTRIGTMDKLSKLLEDQNMTVKIERKNISWGKRSYHSENHHYEKLEKLEEYSWDKPVVICLSGNATKTESEANGFCKITEKWLELLFKDKNTSLMPEDYVDIVGCTYGMDKKHVFFPKDKEFLSLYSNLDDYVQDFPEAETEPSIALNREVTQNEVFEFVCNVLLPRCLNSEGNRLDVDTCCKNMAQVTFCTFCYGAKALNEILLTLEKVLLTKGFSKDEIQKINSAMFHVSFARYEYTRKIPSIFFYDARDQKGGGSISALLTNMEQTDRRMVIRLCRDGQKTIGQQLVPSIFGEDADMSALEFAYLSYSSEEYRRIVLEKDEMINPDTFHSVGNMQRDQDWDIISKKHGVFDAISQMMSWALCRAVENSLKNAKSDKYIPKMPMETLREELISIYKSFKQEDLMTKE